MENDGDYIRCKSCGEVTEVLKSYVEEGEWGKYKCSKCEGKDYGQSFINWIADRISPSTIDDTTGRFVLRELVQNADDVEAEMMVLRFCKDALYVYNDGFGFRSSVDGGPGDFERISKVLAKPKEKEFYTSGNFGSGFQTVYLFTNFPEVHSHGKSFRYNPTGPNKAPLDKDKIDSPYRDKKNKGAVFRLPWRTSKNAVVNGFFKEERPWKRWDGDATYKLFEELREYLHDSLLCCQHLKKIRILWDADNVNVGYQAERDFILRYIDNEGKIGKVTEGKGYGGLLLEGWKYEARMEFEYFIGSTFVSNLSLKQDNITIISSKSYDLGIDDLTGDFCKSSTESYEKYFDVLKKHNAIKKSDIHVLVPLFCWQKRVGEKRRKAWSYSVIPLPKESGNNFTFTAHLFPKQTREAFEMHQEEAKRKWLEKVLLSGADLFLNTYKRYIEKVQGMKNLDDKIKQEIMLDYLPANRLSDWVKVSLDDTEIEINKDIFEEVFNSKILFFDGKWYVPLEPKEEVSFPRNDIERSLLERMGFVTFSESFLNHPRFIELNEFKERLIKKIEVEDDDFVECYKDFFDGIKDASGKVTYREKDREFIETLIDHCLANPPAKIIDSIKIIPNKQGILCSPKELRKEPIGSYCELRSIIPSWLYPHEDFEPKIKAYIEEIKNPKDILEGAKENKEILENDTRLVRMCYEWLESSGMKLPKDIKDYPLVFDDDGHLLSIEDVFWVPDHHHDLIKDFLISRKSGLNLVSKSIFTDFGEFIRDGLKVKMLAYPEIIVKYRDAIEGTEQQRIELQTIMVEGVMMGLANGSWQKNELNELNFLPVNGLLEIPSNTCLGSAGDKELDGFLGSIDEHVQKMIERSSYREAIAGLGCGDLNDDLIGCVISRIDRYAEENEGDEGICRLDEDHHRLISDCLCRLAKVPQFREYKGILEKRILPVDYRGSVMLFTPPRWDQRKGERRLEKYDGDWPWVKPEQNFLYGGAAPVWESIRFIHLHEDFQDAEKAMIREFGIERLIARDGNPRALMMYFLLPKDEPKTSLFFDDSLIAFIGPSHKEDDIDKIKKTFLYYLNGYYKESKHETEKLSVEDKPCLYDDKLVWGTPKEFAFKIDEDLEVLGYHNLSNDFSEEKGWDRNTLTNIGVVARLEFDKIAKAIRKISTEDRNTNRDRIILKTLVLSLQEGIGAKEEWKRLSDVEWVPTKDNGWNKPGDALPMTEKVRRLIGDYGLKSIIDCTSLKGESEDALSRFTEEDFKKVSLRTTPTFEELKKVWVHYQNERRETPPELFNELERRFQEWKEKFLHMKYTGKILYFTDNEWKDPKFVVMGKREDFPEPLRKRFTFTNEHENLLKWMRGELDEDGRPRIKVKDVLAMMDDLSDKEMESVWEFIVARRTEIDEGLRNEFREKEIFLYESQRYPPIRILIPSRDGTCLNFKGKFGDWLSIDSETRPGEMDTLLSLGAQELNKIIDEKSNLQDLIKCIINESPIPGIILWFDYIMIISKMINKGIIIPSDFQIVTIRRDTGIVFKAPKEILIRDDSGIWELFKNEDRLNILDHTLFSKEGTFADKLEDWLRECGARDFKDVMESIEEPDTSNAEQEIGLTDEFKSALKRLNEIVSAEFEDTDQYLINQKIGELQGAFIYSCEKIVRVYEIDMTQIDGGPPISRDITQPYYFTKVQGRWVVFIAKDFDEPMAKLEKMVREDFNPDFEDTYRKRFWENAVKFAFFNQEQITITSGFTPGTYGHESPNLGDNINKLDKWWGGYISDADESSFPTLDGDFWWPALGLDDGGNREKRGIILRGELIKNRNVMFNLFSMATLLSTSVRRNQIKSFLDILKGKGLSFSEMYYMEEEKVIKKMIDDMFEDIDSKGLTETIYPELRRRIFDILTLRRAMKDATIGENILQMIKTHRDDGLSPEIFFTRGRGYGARPFMKGFKGMFTGQIYFIVREMVRLGLADKWKDIAFHAPSQIRELIDNLGGQIPSESKDDWREDFAKIMTRNIDGHSNLNGWYDIPFFIYCDEFCSTCRPYYPPEECKMDCYRRW